MLRKTVCVLVVVCAASPAMAWDLPWENWVVDLLFSLDEFAVISDAHDEAIEHMEDAVWFLESNKPRILTGHSPLYERWFGESMEFTYLRVLRTANGVLDTLEGDYDDGSWWMHWADWRDGAADSLDFAEGITWGVIGLSEAFWEYTELELDDPYVTTWGIVVNQVSQWFGADTYDYGFNDCLCLTSRPVYAAFNADNYRYFAEAIAGEVGRWW